MTNAEYLLFLKSNSTLHLGLQEKKNVGEGLFCKLLHNYFFLFGARPFLPINGPLHNPDCLWAAPRAVMAQQSYKLAQKSRRPKNHLSSYQACSPWGTLTHVHACTSKMYKKTKRAPCPWDSFSFFWLLQKPCEPMVVNVKNRRSLILVADRLVVLHS